MLSSSGKTSDDYLLHSAFFPLLAGSSATPAILGSDQLTLPLALAKLADSSYRIPEVVIGRKSDGYDSSAGLICNILSADSYRLSDWVVSRN